MGVRIDLPIETLEEANFLDKVLLNAADRAKSLGKMRQTTDDEKAQYDKEHELALRLRNRMFGGS